jgi:hypothetical protein
MRVSALRLAVLSAALAAGAVACRGGAAGTRDAGCGGDGGPRLCGNYQTGGPSCCGAEEGCCQVGFEQEACRPIDDCPRLVFCRGDVADQCAEPSLCLYTADNSQPVAAGESSCLTHLPPDMYSSPPTCATGCAPCGPYAMECCGESAVCGDAGCCVLAALLDGGTGDTSPGQ